MDKFDSDKKDVLKKLKEHDKSKIGEVDKPITELIDFINGLKDFYTTSSCSGRIMLIALDDEKRKDRADWLFFSHEKVFFKDLMKNLKKYKSKKELWFKQEPLILHICSRNLKEADKLMRLSLASGFKKVGIIALSRRVILEIKGTDYISTLIGKDGKILVGEDYLKEILKMANEKLENNLKKKDSLFSVVKKNFK